VNDVIRQVRPNGDSHLHHEENGGKSEERVNHFFLGDQMHEKSRDAKGLGGGDQQRNGNIDIVIAKVHLRKANGQDNANDETDRNQQMLPDVSFYIRDVFFVGGGLCHNS
jgi:hypothetical protein